MASKFLDGLLHGPSARTVEYVDAASTLQTPLDEERAINTLQTAALGDQQLGGDRLSWSTETLAQYEFEHFFGFELSKAVFFLSVTAVAIVRATFTPFGRVTSAGREWLDRATLTLRWVASADSLQQLGGPPAVAPGEDSCQRRKVSGRFTRSSYERYCHANSVTPDALCWSALPI
mmetsp:Transcript_15213/g.48897  ORF Transcript_15213/g.48897 Transcript_15213/m.48897 type:complete len:176 (-) Transcript_15213:177-704(-)